MQTNADSSTNIDRMAVNPAAYFMNDPDKKGNARNYKTQFKN